MKCTYKPVSPSVYEKYYISQAGRGIDVYRSPMVYQRGYGIGSLFRSLFRMATPLLKSGARVLGCQALRTTADLANDMLENRDLKEAFSSRMKEAGKNIVSQVMQRGQGRKRRRINAMCARKKLRTREDIFE